MFFPILKFEIAYQLRRPSTYLYFAILFLLSFGIIASDIIEVEGGVGRVMKNGPYPIALTMLVLTAIGQVITSALVGTAILRDFNMKAHELLFTTSMSKFGYLAGRFAGALIAMMLVYLAIPVGLIVGTLMPWVDHEKLAAFHAMWYISPFFVLMVPNLIFISALFFAAGVVTRNQFAIYTLGIFLLVANALTSQLLRDLDNNRVTAITDSFGLSTFELMTRYWTVVEKNALTVPFSGYMMLNRLVWLGAAVLLVAIAYASFRFDAAPRFFGRRRKAQLAAPTDDLAESRAGVAPALVLPDARRSFGGAASWRELASTTRFTFAGIVREIPFLAIATIGIVNVFMSAWFADSAYDNKLYPVTYNMAETITAAFGLFFIILITIYCGELVWKERAIKADQIVDALPVSSNTAILGRLFGFILSLAVLLGVCAVAAMFVQGVKGYTNFEPVLYLKFLYLIELPSLIELTLLAFFVHTIVNNKYFGHFVMLVVFVAVPVITNLGFEHRLYQFGRTPAVTYSDMNRFGHFVPSIAWFTAYWTAFGLLLLVVAALFWVRGTDDAPRVRLSGAAARLTKRVALAGSTFAALTLLFGGAIYYNSDVLNRYDTRQERRQESAKYERQFKKYRALVQPKITDIVVRADLVPERRAFAIAGTFTIVNSRGRPIDTLYVAEPTLRSDAPNIRLDSMRPSRAAALLPASDTAAGIFMYRLAQPLAPGDTMTLGFGIHYANRGFPNGTAKSAIVANGSFINSAYLPSLGYSEDAELTDPDDRTKEKLPPRDRMHPITDTASYHENEFTADADRVSFDATVSTAPDQIAIAPGYLQQESIENGRRVFHYKTEEKIMKFFSFLSARYAVRRDTWQGTGTAQPVAIEIYYQPGHEYNLGRMISSVKKSLDYYTTNFSPYQYRQVRILEFPRYATFAQSFPNTIPYSEGIGFIMKVGSEADDIDFPFFVTAHEVAHQWWGHQIIGANVQGAAIMVESLAEYSALMVMQKEYGRAASQKFFRYELDRYLRGRSTERRREEPLALTEQQAYIHYYKGSLAFYALQDYIGEDKLNAALAKFLREHHYTPGNYPTSKDLIRELRAATPDSLQSVITDLFETITLFDNKADSASWTKRADGKYVVTLAVSARKLRADTLGAEHEIAVGDWIDVGVFGAKEKGNKLGAPLLVTKYHITQPHTVIELVVDREPVRAGIDPYNKLIDREPKDNVKDVAKGA
ncbi:MAG: M1 family aminopeptidase [Gemmatimonadaceae bacterium]